MDIIVRKMTKDDIEGILEIENLCFPMPWSKGAIEAELKNQLSYYVVVEVENKIAAYAGTWFILDEAHITNVAVHPDYRGKKFGNMVMEALFEESKRRSVVSMTLEVRKSNQIAQNLYKKYGFKLSGIRKEYYTDNKEDAFIMWKEF